MIFFLDFWKILVYLHQNNKSERYGILQKTDRRETD